MKPSSETLRFDTLQPYLLLKNGNYLYQVPFRGGWAVLKVYYGSRGFFSQLSKSIENLSAGQTSYMPKTRLRVERECLALWRQHGFRVFGAYEDVTVEAPGCPAGGYLLFEYVTGPKIGDYLRDESRSLDQRFSMYRRFLLEWSRRHDLAIRLREPRLVHENGDGKHVLVLDDGFLWFDFEMVYRRRHRVPEQVSHEIIQYLWQIMKSCPPDLQERLLEETVRGYPVTERLRAAHDCFYRHPNFFHRLGRAIDRNYFTGRRKANSKYSVARRLREKIEALA